MKNLELIKTLNKLGKSYFTLADLSKLLAVDKKSLYTTVSRLTKKGVLEPVSKGIYGVFGQPVVPEEIAPLLYSPSYLSLQTVLAKKGIVNQVPQEVLLITPQRSKRLKLGGTEAVYRQIKKDLFFGWHLAEQIPTAWPEKALLDLCYFVSLGRAYLSLKELDLSSLDQKRWDKFKVYFPFKTQKLISKIEKNISA